jgi:hypothetical protein
MLHLPPISQLRTKMRRAIRQEAAEDVIEKSGEIPAIRGVELLRAE